MQRPVLEMDMLSGREWKHTQKRHWQLRIWWEVITPEGRKSAPAFVLYFCQTGFWLMLLATDRPLLPVLPTFIPQYVLPPSPGSESGLPSWDQGHCTGNGTNSTSMCTQNGIGISKWDKASEFPEKEGQGGQTCASNSEKTISFSFPNLYTTEPFILQNLELCLIFSVACVSQKVNLGLCLWFLSTLLSQIRWKARSFFLSPSLFFLFKHRKMNPTGLRGPLKSPVAHWVNNILSNFDLCMAQDVALGKQCVFSK